MRYRFFKHYFYVIVLLLFSDPWKRQENKLKSTGLKLIAALAMVAAVLIAAPAQASATSSIKFTALGDSFASGVGAGDYQLGTNVPGGCYTSGQSYSVQLVNRLRANGQRVSFTNSTCSGATVDTVRATQLGAVDRRTKLVTLTVGGNDFGFAELFGLCVRADCTTEVNNATTTRLEPMAINLAQLLRQIKQRAPHAQVIMAGYGQPIADSTTPVEADQLCGAFSPSERTAAADLTVALDQTLRRTARAVGASYVSPYRADGSLRPAFAGRSLCDTGTSLYHGSDVFAPGGDGPIAALHPTAEWQRLVARLAMHALDDCLAA